MKDFFLKDSVLKVLSFVIALLLWFYIIAVVDPSVDVTVRDIPIRYTSEDLIKAKGLCLISDEKTTVELKIKGSRKRIANIDENNIYATVDLATISKTGTFSLPIAISIPYEYDEIVSKKPYNAEIFIDKVVEAEREVKIFTVGSTANDYIAGTPSASVSSVMVKGPSTMIESIASVGAELNFDGRAADIKDTKKLFFIDENGKRIADDEKIYDLVTANVETVDVECRVYKQKTVPVTLDYRASENIDKYKISVQPANVTIYAENEVLETVEELLTYPVNLDDISGNGVMSVKIKLPENVFLRDGIDMVNVKVEKRG